MSNMSEVPGSWGSGQVDGPKIEWRIRMVPKAEALAAEREVIARLGERPRDWQALDDRPELVQAGDTLLAVKLAEVRWSGMGVWEYRLSAAGRRAAELLAPQDDRAFRAHPESNYDGGLLAGRS